MNLSIIVSHQQYPAGQPVAIIDTDTGRVVSRHRSTIDALKALAMTTGTDPITDAGLYARCLVSLPPTVAW